MINNQLMGEVTGQWNKLIQRTCGRRKCGVTNSCRNYHDCTGDHQCWEIKEVVAGA